MSRKAIAKNDDVGKKIKGFVVDFMCETLFIVAMLNIFNVLNMNS